MQSTFTGIHAAIIMDGNGRWAEGRGLRRTAGHEAGADAVRRVVESAQGLGIGTLSLYAFSSDNWTRPAGEVRALMALFQRFLREESPRCLAEGVRVNVIGRRDRLPLALRSAIRRTERATAAGRNLLLRLAVDYSARDILVRAAAEQPASREAFAAAIARAQHGAAEAADVDLLIRTGGERRVSDFLLWECAYAELHFSPRPWPEFTRGDLEAAVGEFHRRVRTFGGLRAAV